MAQFSPQSSDGFYLPTTGIYDSQFIYDVDVNSPEFKDYIVRLQQTLNTFALYINNKPSGLYETNEQVAGRLYFSTEKGQDSQIYRQVYRTTINIGALPNNTTKNEPHGIDFSTVTPTATHLYGAATNPTTKQMLPLPYVSTIPNGNIALTADSANINITTTADYSAYTNATVVLEYLRQS